MNTPSCIIPPPPLSHLPCLRLSPHYLNSVQDSLEARIIKNVTTYSSAASLKYFHCSSCVIINLVVLGGKKHYFGGKIRIGL